VIARGQVLGGEIPAARKISKGKLRRARQRKCSLAKSRMKFKTIT